MPTKRKDRHNEWLARVVIEGRQVAARTFPGGRKKGPEWTAAKQWEVETKTRIVEALASGQPLRDALEALGLVRAAAKIEVQPDPSIVAGLERLSVWIDGYLDMVELTMDRSSYVEKETHMKAFCAFCKQEDVASLETVTKSVARKFLVSVYRTKEEEVAYRSAINEGKIQLPAGTPKPKGKIGNPASVANKHRKNLLAAWNWGIDNVEGFPQTISPFAQVKEFPVDEGERYVPPEDDVVKVLELAKGQDLIMLMVFYYTGARAGEVFRLSWARDIHLAEGKIRLSDHKTKGGKIRVRWNDMHPELVKALAWWYENRPCKVDNVFMQTHCDSAKGLPFKHRSKFCERLCKRAGVKPFVFYSIRHVSAHLAFSDGGISAAKSLLGHYHATTTDMYLRKMGMFTDQAAIQSSLGQTEIGQAGVCLLEKLTAGDTLHDGQQREKEKSREVATHGTFCNQESVTSRLQ